MKRIHQIIANTMVLSAMCGCSDVVSYLGHRTIYVQKSNETNKYSASVNIKIKRFSTNFAIFGYNVELQKGCILACRAGDRKRADVSELVETPVCLLGLPEGYAPIDFAEAYAEENITPKWTTIPNYTWTHTLELHFEGKQLNVAQKQSFVTYEFSWSSTGAGRAETERCKEVSVLPFPKARMLASLHMGPMLISPNVPMRTAEGGEPVTKWPKEDPPKKYSCEQITPILPQTRTSIIKLRCNLVSSIKAVDASDWTAEQWGQL